MAFGGSELWRMGFVIWWWIGDAGLWRSLMRSFDCGDLVVDRWHLVVGAVANDLEEKTREMGVERERESESVKEIRKW